MLADGGASLHTPEHTRFHKINGTAHILHLGCLRFGAYRFRPMATSHTLVCVVSTLTHNFYRSQHPPSVRVTLEITELSGHKVAKQRTKLETV